MATNNIMVISLYIVELWLSEKTHQVCCSYEKHDGCIKFNDLAFLCLSLDKFHEKNKIGNAQSNNNQVVYILST